MNSTLQPLVETNSLEEFTETLNTLKRTEGVTPLTNLLGIDYQRMYNILKKNRASVRTIVMMSSALNKETGTSREKILANLCGFFGYRPISAAEAERMDKKREKKFEPTGPAEPTKPARPSYLSQCPIPGFSNTLHRTTYSEHNEIEDAAAVLKARENPQNGLECALEKFWWLVQTETAEKIHFTRDEAIIFEAFYRLSKIMKAESRYGLENAFEMFDLYLLPDQIKDRDGEKDIYKHRRSPYRWEHAREPENKETIVTSEQKLKAIGKTREDMRKIFFDRLAIIAGTLVEKIREKHQEERTDKLLQELEECLPHITGGWSALSIPYSETIRLVGLSMEQEAARQAAKLIDESLSIGDRRRALEKIVKIMTKWGFGWETVTVTVATAVTFLVKATLADMKVEKEALFALPGTSSALDDILGKF